MDVELAPSGQIVDGATLVATLGGQPQVITFALDALLRRGETIGEVYVLHLSLDNPRTRQALARLAQEFVDDQYGDRHCRLRRVPIAVNGKALEDIRTEAGATATWQVIRDLLAGLKEQNRRLHLCLSGGRRLMAMLAMSAAALLCDHQDHVWHMYTPDALREQAEGGAIMHVGPESGMQLIQTPIVPWGEYFPALRTLAQTSVQSAGEQLRWLTAAGEQQCRQVYERLSLREREVLRAFARGLRPQEVADELMIGLSTVNSHKTVILAECRAAWEIGDKTRLDYRFLREHFAGFVSHSGAV
ncbi:MAG: histidine kinase [Caldilineaceae bacterium]|nr:histidine kinase [Caldilineaceae bacterium]